MGEPRALLQTFTRATENVLGYLSEQIVSIGKWMNVSGNLVKISVSPSGYTWGYSADGRMYYNTATDKTWKHTPLPKEWSGALASDVATDDNFVYFIFTNSRLVAFRAVDGSGDFLPSTTTPFLATSIVSTNNQLIAGGDGSIAIAEKPLTTMTTFTVKENRHNILGAGKNTIYGTKPGKLGLERTDDTLQGSWKEVPGFKDKSISALAAEADNSMLYAADANTIYKCDSECSTVEKVRSQGLVPIQSKGALSVDPTTKSVWMVTGSRGAKGNIYERVDGSDPEQIFDHVEKVDVNRDRIFNTLGQDVGVEQDKLERILEVEEARSAVQKALDVSGQKKNVDEEVSILRRRIEAESGASGGYSSKMKVLYILLLSLLLVVLLYFTVGFFVPTTVLMGLAILVLGAGFSTAIFYGNR